MKRVRISKFISENKVHFDDEFDEMIELNPKLVETIESKIENINDHERKKEATDIINSYHNNGPSPFLVKCVAVVGIWVALGDKISRPLEKIPQVESPIEYFVTGSSINILSNNDYSGSTSGSI